MTWHSITTYTDIATHIVSHHEMTWRDLIYYILRDSTVLKVGTIGKQTKDNQLKTMQISKKPNAY